MTLAEFVADVVSRLEAVPIEYMIGGSVASSIYGEPRTTRDIDIVVEVTSDSLASLSLRSIVRGCTSTNLHAANP